MNRKSGFGLLSLLLVLAPPAMGHIEYYDLNQASHIRDLTAAGKTQSTAQYGTTPANVLALNGPPLADGIGGAGLSAQQDMPLNDPSLWNATYHIYDSLGIFSGVVYTPEASSATVDVSDVADFAWADGTMPALGLGDSHKVDMFNFRLSQASEVTITWNVDAADAAPTFLDCAFSLYSGVLPYQGHDDSVEILNPFRFGVKVQGSLDIGTYRDVQDILSPFRNTAPGAPHYRGQFNALGNWSQANPAGNWGAIAFITAVNAKITQLSGTASDTMETLTISLPAGNYTIAASGALGAAGSGASLGLTNLHGRLTFNAVTAQDTTPDPFVFTDRDGVSPGVLSASNAISVTGINAPSPIAVSGDPSSEYSVNGDAFTNAAGTVNNGDAVVVRHQSSVTFGASIDTILSIGGVTDTFTSTTGVDATPDPFTFEDLSGVDLSTDQFSNEITVTGIETAAPVSITGGSYSVNGGPYTSADGMVNNNDRVRVRHTSAATQNTRTDTTPTIGGVSDTFSSVTEVPQTGSGGRVGGTAAMDAFVLLGLALVGWLKRRHRTGGRFWSFRCSERRCM